MSWNINLTVATAASGGDIPISDATISWIDGGTSHSINNSSAFSPSNEAGTVTVGVNQASTNFTATCTGFSPQTLGGNSSTGSLLFKLAATSGGELKQEGTGGGISTQCLRREAGTGRGEVGRGLVHADRHCPGFIGGAKGARVIDRMRRAAIDPRNGGVRDGDIASAGGGGHGEINIPRH